MNIRHRLILYGAVLVFLLVSVLLYILRWGESSGTEMLHAVRPCLFVNYRNAALVQKDGTRTVLHLTPDTVSKEFQDELERIAIPGFMGAEIEIEPGINFHVMSGLDIFDEPVRPFQLEATIDITSEHLGSTNPAIAIRLSILPDGIHTLEPIEFRGESSLWRLRADLGEVMGGVKNILQDHMSLMTDEKIAQANIALEKEDMPALVTIPKGAFLNAHQEVVPHDNCL